MCLNDWLNIVVFSLETKRKWGTKWWRTGEYQYSHAFICALHMNTPWKMTHIYSSRKKEIDRRTYKQVATCTGVDTLGACAPDILQSTVGAGETVMDYRHIWAVISRSHIPPAFSGRQKSSKFPIEGQVPWAALSVCMRASCHYCIYYSGQNKATLTHVLAAVLINILQWVSMSWGKIGYLFHED